jgi:hypothetical protein
MAGENSRINLREARKRLGELVTAERDLARAAKAFGLKHKLIA